MATIKNSDFSVGITRKINQYEQDQETVRKHVYFRNLLYSDNPYEHAAKTMTLDDKSLEQQHNLPGNFNNLIQIFEFAPPSDNLWNVEITMSDVAGTMGADERNNNLLQLYTNILAVNKTWASNKNERWNVNLQKAKVDVDQFITKLTNSDIGFFLAQQVNFTPLSANVDDNPFGDFQQNAGFFRNSTVVKSTKFDNSLKINFLVSNYDITDILIEPWCAAITQQGLIEDSSLRCIKAKIILTEYSASYPKSAIKKKYEGFMKPRKQYIFENCFPIQRDEIKKEYSPNEAGVYKNQPVTFKYDNYKINYLF